MAAAAAFALAFTGCELATPADFLRDGLAVVTVKEMEARHRSVVTPDGADIGPGTATIALILDNSRKIPLKKLSLDPPITDDGHISWDVEQMSAGEALVTINGAVLGDILSVTLRIGGKGRDFPTYTFAVRCTPAAGGDIWKVTFDTQGQGPIEPQSVSGGSILGYPDPPDYTGYYVEGWYRESNCTTRWDFVKDIVIGDVTLYAKWASTDTAVKYTVTFDMQGHGTAPIPQIVYEGGYVSAPATAPTATGWTFGGWYPDNTTSGTQWEFNVPVTGNTTLYAKWTPISYTVTYVSPTYGTSSTPPSVTRNYGDTVTKPADPNETGYTFEGWYKAADCLYQWDFATDKVTGNTDLYAKWTRITHTVTFDFGFCQETQTVNHDNTASYPVAPDYGSNDVAGWYADSGFSSPYDFATPVIADKILYANWQSYDAIDFGAGVTIPGTNIHNVSSQIDWTNAITHINSNSGNHIINLTADISPGSNTQITSNSTISIRGNYNVSQNSSNSLLRIANSNANVTLRGPTLQGKNGAQSVVYVFLGTFNFRAGNIIGNTSTISGGGVLVGNTTTFIMSGGTISGNNTAQKGGGVYVSGTFTMSGGTISGNNASADGGGGVYVDFGTFKMLGGSISGNNATNGGGVYVNNGTFKKTGGTITGSDALGGYGNTATMALGSTFAGHTVNLRGNTKYRNTTAGLGDNVDTTNATTDTFGNGTGFWTH